MEPWIRIIIVNYNSGGWIDRCLDSLAAQEQKDFEVMIVDNASTDGSCDRLRLPDDRFRLLRLDVNLGFAGGSNRGVEGARTPWIATLNPDAIPAPDWLRQVHDATEQYPATAMFGSTQIMVEDPGQLDGCGDVYSIFGIPWRGGHGLGSSARPATDGRVFSPCGAAAFYRRDVFEKVGGFDETFFCYLEDVDLGFRLRLIGEECIQLHEAIVHHAGSASTGAQSDFTLYYSYRNRVWLLVKDMPGPLLLIGGLCHLAAFAWLALRAWNLEPLAPRLRGFWDGVLDLCRVWRQRRSIQKTRTTSALKIARMLVWSPLGLRRRVIHFLNGP